MAMWRSSPKVSDEVASRQELGSCVSSGTENWSQPPSAEASSQERFWRWSERRTGHRGKRSSGHWDPSTLALSQLGDETTERLQGAIELAQRLSRYSSSPENSPYTLP